MSTIAPKSVEELKAEAAALADQIRQQESAEREARHLAEKIQKMRDSIPARMTHYRRVLDLHCSIRAELKSRGYDSVIIEQGKPNDVAPTPEEAEQRYREQAESGEYISRIQLRFAFNYTSSVSVFYDDQKESVCVEDYAANTKRNFRKRNNETHNIEGIAVAYKELRANEVARQERKVREANLVIENKAGAQRIKDTAAVVGCIQTLLPGTATVTPSQHSLDSFVVTFHSGSLNEEQARRITETLKSLGVTINA